MKADSYKLVPCPKCGARKGDPCSGKGLRSPHPERTRLALWNVPLEALKR